MNGKGSKQRPSSVSKKQYEDNYNSIFKPKDKPQHELPNSRKHTRARKR